MDRQLRMREATILGLTTSLRGRTGGDRENDFPVWLDCNPVCEYVSGLIAALGEKV